MPHFFPFSFGGSRIPEPTIIVEGLIRRIF
jgi:hypothetical protein